MVEIKTRDEFISAAMQLMVSKPDSNVMILIDNGPGLEVLQTQPSFIWSFGVLRAAEKMFDERYRAMMDAEINRRMEEISMAAMDAAVEAGKKEPN